MEPALPGSIGISFRAGNKVAPSALSGRPGRDANADFHRDWRRAPPPLPLSRCVSGSGAAQAAAQASMK